jgi:hypothetical protein
MIRQIGRQLRRPVNLAQVVLGLVALRLGLAVVADDDIDRQLWSWTAPVLLVLVGVFLLSSLWPRRR